MPESAGPAQAGRTAQVVLCHAGRRGQLGILHDRGAIAERGRVAGLVQQGLVPRQQAGERAHVRGRLRAAPRALPAPALLMHVRRAAGEALEVGCARPAGHLGRAYVALCTVTPARSQAGSSACFTEYLHTI